MFGFPDTRFLEGLMLLLEVLQELTSKEGGLLLTKVRNFSVAWLYRGEVDAKALPRDGLTICDFLVECSLIDRLKGCLM